MIGIMSEQPLAKDGQVAAVRLSSCRLVWLRLVPR
jgi:hypothetical protein